VFYEWPVGVGLPNLEDANQTLEDTAILALRESRAFELVPYDIANRNQIIRENDLISKEDAFMSSLLDLSTRGSCQAT
jgi:hypothetical protein